MVMVKNIIKSLFQHFRPDGRPSVILFASPRGGSTWVSELVASQCGFWPISEPLNVRSAWVQEKLGIDRHSELYDDASLPKIQAYYTSILDGKYPDLKLLPGRPFYNFVTKRLIIKENQGCLDRIPWFEDTLGVRVIHLLRHPIPVALSREVFPLLDGFSSCKLRERFSNSQLAFADSLIAEGTHLERGVLAWCLHHVPALQDQRNSWVTVTYEETVLEPDRVIERLAESLDLDERDKMRDQVSRPSLVTLKSNLQTQALLESGAGRGYLVEKWKEHVTSGELTSVQSILDVFEVTMYSAGEFLPLGLKNKHV